MLCYAEMDNASRYCHVGLIPSNAMLNECRLTFTVATGFHEKSSQNASGITFDLA